MVDSHEQTNITIDTLILKYESKALAIYSEDLKIVTLSAGEELFSEGDISDSIYLVKAGILDVRKKQDKNNFFVLNKMASGSIIGELGLISDQARSASIVAFTDVELIKFSKEFFSSLPKIEIDLLTNEKMVTRRWKRLQLAQVFSKLFGVIATNEIHRLQNQLTWMNFKNGETIYSHGDESDGLYFVINGRVRYRKIFEGETQTANDICSGEPFGEFGMLSGGKRDGSITAVRDSEVVKINPEMFSVLESNHPGLSEKINKIYAKRFILSKDNEKEDVPSVNITIIPVSSDVDLTSFISQLEVELTKTGTTLILNEDTMLSLSNSSINTNHNVNIFQSPVIKSTFTELEENNDYLLFIGEHSASNWTKASTGQSDKIILVGNSDSQNIICRSEEYVNSLTENIQSELVILYSGEVTNPISREEILKDRAINGFHEINNEDPFKIHHLTNVLRNR